LFRTKSDIIVVIPPNKGRYNVRSDDLQLLSHIVKCSAKRAAFDEWRCFGKIRSTGNHFTAKLLVLHTVIITYRCS
jgi:hypothetical protein